MSVIIDLDSMRSETGLKIEETTRGVTVREIFREWERVKKSLGNPPLGLPTVIENPKHPVHFGITLEWKVLLNIASVPGWLNGKTMLDWLRDFPISHEIGHYVFCPYDGVTHARLAMKVMESWVDVTEQDILFIINYFSDIIVNCQLHSIYKDAFFDAMKQWIEYTTIHVLKNGGKISVSYLVFVHVHELLLQKRFMTFNYSDEIRGLATRIANIFQFSSSWYETIAKLTTILKLLIPKERRGGFHGSGAESLTNIMIEKVRAYHKGDPIPGKDDKTCNDDNKCNDNASNSSNKNENAGSGDMTSVLVKKNKKATEMPMDMTIFMGDPLSTKTIGEINEDEKKMEQKNLSFLIRKMDIPFSVTKKLCAFMKIAETEETAWRFWLRSKAEGLIEYNVKTIQRFKGGCKVPSDWDWGAPLSDWNLMQSVMRMPPYPFPPFASGNKEYKGPKGSATLPEVRDLLIVRDSSGSMAMMMNNAKREWWTNSVSIVHKINNKFNISCLVSFAALLSAIKKGAWFSVINFSTHHSSTPWLKPDPANLDKAERLILQFQRMGTVIPIDEIGRLVDQRKNAFVLVITDGYLHNWTYFLKSISEFKNKKYEIAMMFLVEKEEHVDDDIKSELAKRNVKIHYISSPEDLFSITMREVARVYA